MFVSEGKIYIMIQATRISHGNQRTGGVLEVTTGKLPNGGLAGGHSLLVYRKFLRTFSLYLVSFLLSFPVICYSTNPSSKESAVAVE
jgi:hypothetical protein